jgi:hypothetical protein
VIAVDRNVAASKDTDKITAGVAGAGGVGDGKRAGNPG